MKLFISIILSLFFANVVCAQADYLTQEQLKQRIKECKKIDWEKVNSKSKFLYCHKAYSQTFNYRKALDIINMAQKKFPYDYEVRKQNAVALGRVGSVDRAISELQGLILLYPNKAELHNYLARLYYPEQRTPALMAFLWSQSINPKSEYSGENKAYIKRLLSPGFSKGTKIKNAEKARGFSENHQKILTVVGKNDFSHVDYELSTGKSNPDEISFFEERINLFIDALSSTTHARTGFMWENYAPYFLKLQENQLENTYCRYLINDDVWLEKHSSLLKRLSVINRSFGF